MALCDRCKNKCKFMLKNKTLDTCGLFEKQTNFGRITASPEALAEFISGLSACCDCPADKLCVNYQECYKAMLEWLKQESE